MKYIHLVLLTLVLDYTTQDKVGQAHLMLDAMARYGHAPKSCADLKPDER